MGRTIESREERTEEKGERVGEQVREPMSKLPSTMVLSPNGLNNQG